MNPANNTDAKVAFLGPVGTFSHAAVLKYFGESAGLQACATIDDVFSAIDTGSAVFGVVPVENSTEGAVNNTLDCLVETGKKIVGEVIVPIEHCFMYRRGTKPSTLTKIVSHKQSLAQCRKWLNRNWPEIPKIECASNAEAARIAASEEGVAAIAGVMAAQLYHLQISDEKIQDQVNNSTRFLVLADAEAAPSGKDKTSTLIYTQNKPGALLRILEPFDHYQVNLTRIETRPSKLEVWDYVFFIDFEGNVQDEPVRRVLEKLKACTAEVKLLGSYPVASGKG